MGLELVEIILSVEDEFNVKIDDLEWSHIVTTGDLYRVVIEAREKSGQLPEADKDKNDIYIETWQKLRCIISEQIQVDINIIHEDAHLIRDLGID